MKRKLSLLVALVQQKIFLKKVEIGEVQDDNNFINKNPIIDLIDCHFTFKFNIDVKFSGTKNNISKEETVYLNSGYWYVLDTNYTQFIEESYTNLKRDNEMEIERLYREYGLNVSSRNEELYNDHEFEERVIKTDKVFVNKVEICDLLILEEDRAYVICNKREPKGPQARDLLNQINASALLLAHDFENVISKFYESLCTNDKINAEKISKESFKDSFKNVIYKCLYY